MKIALFSGGYDPLHKGHVSGFYEVLDWADKIIVGLNSDEWLRRKKGYVFMLWEDRSFILEALFGNCELETWGFDDYNNTAENLISKVLKVYPTDMVYFCNGGDVTKCPEETLVNWPSNVSFLYGVGGGKIESSSDLVRRAYEEMQGDTTKLNAGIMVGPW